MRPPALIASIVLAAAACGSSPAFGADDLAAIILQESEAPDGTQFVADQSGTLALEEVTRDETQSSELLADGFVSGYDAIFASPGLAGVEGDISRSNAKIIDSSVFLFETSAGAEASFARIRDSADDTFSAMGEVTTLVVEGLGTDSFGVQVTFSDPFAGPDLGIVHTWRVDNVILQVVVWGESVDQAGARTLVDVVDGRARP